MEENRRRVSLALFDFDGTLLPGDSIISYLGFSLRRGALSPGEYARLCGAGAAYALGFAGDHRVKSRALRFWREMTPEGREALDRAFAQDVLLPRVYPRARACLEEHRRAGRTLLLVTASTRNYMQYAADGLGFSGLLATEFQADGTLGENCKGEEKPRRIYAWLKERGLEGDFAASWAYGDSESDLPMLRLCGHSFLVNPGKRAVKAAPDMQRLNWKTKDKGRNLP